MHLTKLDQPVKIYLGAGTYLREAHMQAHRIASTNTTLDFDPAIRRADA